MGPVMAARSPGRFLAWLSGQPIQHQQWAARKAKKVMARKGGTALKEFYERFPVLREEPRPRRFDPLTDDPRVRIGELVRLADEQKGQPVNDR